MSKLSPALKSLVAASVNRSGPNAAPSYIRSVYEEVAQDASEKGLGLPTWLTMSTAATITMNSPDSLVELYHLASIWQAEEGQAVYAAELMREIGLKCISFNGIPRTINSLSVLYASLSPSVRSAMRPPASRSITIENISALQNRGQNLWQSIYGPHARPLLSRLNSYHPNLGTYILEAHYGTLLADADSAPPCGLLNSSSNNLNTLPITTSTTASTAASTAASARTGRILTSVLAVSCLRAEAGVARQLTSHIHGLKRAFGEETRSGNAEMKVEEEGEADGKMRKHLAKEERWLATDEGVMWVLESVDRIVAAFGNRAVDGGARAKL